MQIYILSGPIHSGKTTRLQQWAAGRADVGGVLSPDIDGKRHFVDIQTGATFQMEAEPREKKVQKVGKFRFATAAFIWASEKLTEVLEKPGIKWVVIDEIGPLELEGQGFTPALESLLLYSIPEVSLVLVVREGLVEKVVKRFRLKNVKPFEEVEQG